MSSLARAQIINIFKILSKVHLNLRRNKQTSFSGQNIGILYILTHCLPAANLSSAADLLKKVGPTPGLQNIRADLDPKCLKDLKKKLI